MTKEPWDISGAGRQHEYRLIHRRERRWRSQPVLRLAQGLGQSWQLNDKAADGCRIRYVPASEKGDLITLTIGGNDLLADQEMYVKEGLGSFAEEQLGLLTRIRASNPTAFLIVGNIYVRRRRPFRPN